MKNDSVFARCAAKFDEFTETPVQAHVPQREAYQKPPRFESVYFTQRVFRDYGSVKAASMREYIERSSERVAREDALSGDLPRYMLTGSQGCGKTFFAVRLCRAYFANDKDFLRLFHTPNSSLFKTEPLFPVYCDLNLAGKITEEEAFSRLLYQTACSVPSSVSAEAFEEYLNHRSADGSAFLIFDSCDCLNEAEWRIFDRGLSAFLEKRQQIQVLLIGKQSLSVGARGFKPLRLCGIRTEAEAWRFAEGWFNAYYADAELARKALAELQADVAASAPEDTAILLVNPLCLSYYLYRFPERRRDKAAFYDGLVSLQLRRCLDRRDMLLSDNQLRTLASCLCAADYFDGGMTLERIEQAAAGLFDRNLMFENADAQAAVCSLLRCGLLSPLPHQPGCYGVALPQACRRLLCAEAVLEENAGHDCDFLIEHAVKYHEVAVMAASLSAGFAKALFRSVIDRLLDGEAPDDRAEAVLGAIGLTVIGSRGVKISPGMVDEFCGAMFREVSVSGVLTLARVLTDGVLRVEQIRDSIESHFREAAERGEMTFGYAIAATELCACRESSFATRLESLLQSGDLYEQAAALHVLSLLGKLLLLKIDIEAFFPAAADIFPLSGVAHQALTRLLLGFPQRKLAAYAAWQILGSGAVRREALSVSDEALSARLADKRDSAAEILLLFSDILRKPFPSGEPCAAAQRYYSLFTQADSIEKWALYFRLSVAAGFPWKPSDFFRFYITLDEKLEEQGNAAHSLVYAAFCQTSAAVEVLFKSRHRLVFVINRARRGDKMFNKLIEKRDGEALAMTAVLFRRGVVLRLFLMEEEPVEFSPCGWLEFIGLIARKDNFAMMEYALAKEGFSGLTNGSLQACLEALMARGDAPCQPLREDVALFYESYVCDNDLEAVAALVLLCRVYGEAYRGLSQLDFYKLGAVNLTLMNHGVSGEIRRRILGVLRGEGE